MHSMLMILIISLIVLIGSLKIIDIGTDDIHTRRSRAIDMTNKKILRFNKRCDKKRAKRTAKDIKQIIRELKYAYTKGFDTFRPSPGYATMYEALNVCKKYCKDNNIEYKLCQCEFEFVSKEKKDE